MIKILMLKEYSLVLIARIEELTTELGEPDCKLIEPYEIKSTDTGDFLQHWPSFSMQREMIIHSDSILTILEPDAHHLDKYQSLTAKKVNEKS
tara:strand:+ start:240 stop:518 length:279 start_codon:yes stop_codon:yes gene_type:complete